MRTSTFPLCISLLAVFALVLPSPQSLRAQPGGHASENRLGLVDLGLAQASKLQEAGELGKMLVEMISSYMKNPDATLRDPAFKEKLVKLGVALQATGKLKDSLDFATLQALNKGLLPPEMDEATRSYVVSMIANAIHAELQQRGMTADGATRAYQSWPALSDEIHSKIDAHGAKQNHMGTPEFWETHAEMTRGNFSAGNAVDLLIDGPQSFAKREEIIDAAKKEILIMSWAIEDDKTGEWLKQKLLKKAAEGVKVKVMVDGLTSHRIGYSKILGELEAAGIDVVRWRSADPSRSFDGQHRKMLIVDGKDMVAGGLNWGDHYSHFDPANIKPWRDTDLYVEGPAVHESRELFRSLWNDSPSQKGKPKLAYQKPVKSSSSEANKSVAIVNHHPGDGSNILNAVAHSLRSAQKEVYIENAYFILDPVVEKAIADARKRGVRVVVMTNSAESVDEPIVSRPIMRSVNKLIELGAEVHLKTGHLDTLHSKAMLVDGEYSWVGSQNFHPRSYRYEGEVIVSVKDKKFAGEMKSMFEKDMQGFKRQTTPVPLKDSPLADLQEELFFDQL